MLFPLWCGLNTWFTANFFKSIVVRFLINQHPKLLKILHQVVESSFKNSGFKITYRKVDTVNKNIQEHIFEWKHCIHLHSIHYPLYTLGLQVQRCETWLQRKQPFLHMQLHRSQFHLAMLILPWLPSSPFSHPVALSGLRGLITNSNYRTINDWVISKNVQASPWAGMYLYNIPGQFQTHF